VHRGATPNEPFGLAVGRQRLGRDSAAVRLRFEAAGTGRPRTVVRKRRPGCPTLSYAARMKRCWMPRAKRTARLSASTATPAPRLEAGAFQGERTSAGPQSQSSGAPWSSLSLRAGLVGSGERAHRRRPAGITGVQLLTQTVATATTPAVRCIQAALV